MSDDFVVGGIIPDEDTSEDDEFDPNAVESDDFLDDEEEDVLAEPDAIIPGEVADDDDEDESTYFDPDDK